MFCRSNYTCLETISLNLIGANNLTILVVLHHFHHNCIIVNFEHNHDVLKSAALIGVNNLHFLVVLQVANRH